MKRIATGALLAVLLLSLLAACETPWTELKLHARSYQSLDRGALENIVLEQTSFRLELIQGLPGESGIDALVSGRADLALVNNSRPFQKGLRAVVPVHESVLHVLVSEELGSFALTDSLAGLDIFLANGSKAALQVMTLLAERQQLALDDFRLVDEFDPLTTDLIVYFGPINPADMHWYREGFSLVDLGGTTSSGGVEYLLPRMRSAMIPARTYDIAGNDGTLRTLGVMTLLLTHKHTPEQAIYDLMETLVELKPRFMSVAPSLFSAVNDDFEPLELNFPLHSGSRRYLERDEPTKLERYAELINLLVYLTILVITGSLAAYRWRAHRKKDRIDDFYLRALQLRKQADGGNEAELIDALNALEEEAFQSLTSDKLAADESFRIFTELVGRARQELSLRAEPWPAGKSTE